MKRSKETITLGSGKLYITEFDSKSGIPEKEVLETEENRIGWIKGGAELGYTPEYYTAEDDLGMVKKRVIQSEEVTLKSGIMTWNGETFKKLCNTGRITEKEGIRTIKIGGSGNYDGKSYIIHFVHTDKVDGDVRVTIVGQNTAGFTLAFAKDAETVIDAEFNALPCDNEGTLVIVQEEIDQITEQTVNLDNNEESGSEGPVL